jgi:hypothetical protein
MTQLLSTIFFSAAALAALGVLFTMLLDNMGDIRRALGIVDAAAMPSSTRVHVRRGGRAAAMPAVTPSLRAAA